uniref:Helitron helicase-like domain-containing protein n=1 Tax=Octopus bimaculoides TaxID=37653 RepID=A0A0L8GZH5_OCTBM
MTFVRHYGRPDLFITFTCNPKWVEVTRELLPHQQYFHRHDLIARVFKQKLTTLIDLIKKGQVFGPVKCHMYTVEWQKRGLPHAHILVWLVTKIDPILIDESIKAEIPNPTVDRQLYDIVKAHMVHGLCGPGFQNFSSCHKDHVCTKRYPKSFVDETQTAGDGYQLYRRRRPENGGFTLTLQGHQVDNRWVVPYCPLLMTIFNAHINVEFCHSVKSINYICKYVNKGSDAAMFGLQKDNSMDEVSQYLAGREQTAAQLAANPKQTTLTVFFRLCQIDTFAKTLLYPQVPSYYVWSKNTWVHRKSSQDVQEHPGVKFNSCLGRVYITSQPA